MNDNPPDRIVVQAVFDEEVEADRAEIELVVSGSSYFSGREALHRAKEVREVVELLAQNGVAEGDIKLCDIVAESSKGALTESSSAHYTLRAVCRELDRIADVLVAATRPKHTRLSTVTWKYPEDEELENARIAAAMRRARAKSEVIAETLGVVVSGVHLAEFDIVDSEASNPMPMTEDKYGALAVKSRRTVSAELDMSVLHTKRIGVRARVEYRVSGLG